MPVTTADLPRYLHAFDVCLIPFLQNQFNYDCDPLKFYQYTAMGKPVVSTPVRVADRYSDVCFVARTAEEFVTAIATAVAESDRPDRLAARLAVARRHGWGNLVEEAVRTLSTVRGETAIATGPARPATAGMREDRR